MFPGQGSQYVGMGKDIYQHFSEVKEVFDMASDVLGYDLTKICFYGTEDVINQTVNTQPLLLTVSMAIQAVFDKNGIAARAALGHSLGEYSALVYAKVLKFDKALKLVMLRGQYMQEVAAGRGGMAAILGLDRSTVDEICHDISKEHIVEAVNYNCPGQIVIAGTKEGLEAALEKAKTAGARKCVMLSVSGPFHSSLMKLAGEKLADHIDSLEISDFNIPVISNVSADYMTKDHVKDLLIKQVYSPVRWQEGIERILNDGYDVFVEVGPGKVLTGLLKRINKKAVALNASDVSSIENSIKKLLG